MAAGDFFFRREVVKKKCKGNYSTAVIVAIKNAEILKIRLSFLSCFLACEQEAQFLSWWVVWATRRGGGQGGHDVYTPYTSSANLFTCPKGTEPTTFLSDKGGKRNRTDRLEKSIPMSLWLIVGNCEILRYWLSGGYLKLDSKSTLNTTKGQLSVI